MRSRSFLEYGGRGSPDGKPQPLRAKLTLVTVQSKNAERSLLNERYQRAADMLGSDVLAVRLGGIYALRRLASEYPYQYHVPVMELFCAYAVYPTDAGNIVVRLFGRQTVNRLRRDVQSVMEAIGSRTDGTCGDRGRSQLPTRSFRCPLRLLATPSRELVGRHFGENYTGSMPFLRT